MTYGTVVEYKEAVQCNYCDKALIGNSIDAGWAGWDWYTGVSNMTRHACPEHVLLPEWIEWKKQALIEALADASA